MRLRLAAAGLVVLATTALLLLLEAGSSRADPGADHPLPNGHFYRQANGRGGAGESGFAIVDDESAPFWTEFQRLGGVDWLGYPASRRFRLTDGFLYQVSQGGLLQWRPEAQQVYLANTFELLEAAGLDDWLFTRKGVPRPIKDDASGGDWPQARETRLSWLTDVAIRGAYFANPNPAANAQWDKNRAIQLWGLPMSRPEKHGPFISQRFQRVAFQRWVEVVAGMPPPGTVVRVLAGDLLKEAGLVPGAAAVPEEPRGDGGTPVPIVTPTAPLVPWPAPTALPSPGPLLLTQRITFNETSPVFHAQIGGGSLFSHSVGWVVELNDFAELTPGRRLMVLLDRVFCPRPPGLEDKDCGPSAVFIYQSRIGPVSRRATPGPPLWDSYYLDGRPAGYPGNIRRAGTAEGWRAEPGQDYFVFVFTVVGSPQSGPMAWRLIPKEVDVTLLIAQS